MKTVARCLIIMESLSFIQILGQRVTDVGSKINSSSWSSRGLEGYWGTPSATVDWCEENYVFSEYIAEFFNTISSFAMVAVGIFGILFHYKKFERRFLLAFGTVAVVGFGSAAFHGTLLFSLQMLDELPMIYSALVMSFIILEQKKPSTSASSGWLALGLSIHAIFTTLLVASPAFFPEYSSPILQFICFHISFAILEIFLLVRCIQMYFEEEDAEVKKLYLAGVFLWCAGITCWVIDYFGCENIWEGDDGLRKKYLWWSFDDGSDDGLVIMIPNPQFHSWWHVCASSGLYLLSIVVAYNRATVLGYKGKIRYYLGIFPYVDIKKTIFTPTTKSHHTNSSHNDTRKVEDFVGHTSSLDSNVQDKKLRQREFTKQF